jgi:hypothetical protein
MSDALLVGLLAAGVAILANIVTNVIASVNTGRQLKHDREQKAAERELALRKEVYLGVAENLYTGMTMLAATADPNQPWQQTTASWRGSQHYIGKMHLMAGPALVHAVSQANITLAQVLVALNPLRTRLDWIKQQQAFLQKLIDSHYSGSEAAKEYLRQIQLEGKETREDAQRVIEVGRRQVASAMEFSVKHDALAKQMLDLQRQMLVFVVESQTKILAKIVPVIKAAREELKVHFDEQAYGQLLSNMTEHAKFMKKAVSGEGTEPEGPAAPPA